MLTPLTCTFHWLECIPNAVQPSLLSNFGMFSSPQKDIPCHLKPSCLILPPLQLLTTIHVLSVCMDFPILDLSYKGNHIICGLLRTQSFMKTFAWKPGVSSSMK